MGDKNKKDIWFPAMEYGWGWGLPVKWQGWLVYLGYCLLMTIGSILLSNYAMAAMILIIYILIITGLLFFICWKKGEKPKWRWGDK